MDRKLNNTMYGIPIFEKVYLARLDFIADSFVFLTLVNYLLHVFTLRFETDFYILSYLKLISNIDFKCPHTMESKIIPPNVLFLVRF